MNKLNPITREQINTLKIIEHGEYTGRFMWNKMSVSLTHGDLHGGNIMYQLFYMDKSKEFFNKGLEYICQQNPELIIKVELLPKKNQGGK